MKVLPNGADTALYMAKPLQPASTPAETSFAALLHGDDGLVVPAQRRQAIEAVGLDALGVFGRYGAQPEKEISVQPVQPDERFIASAIPAVHDTTGHIKHTSPVSDVSSDRSIEDVPSYAALNNIMGSLERAPASLGEFMDEATLASAVIGSGVNPKAPPAVRDPTIFNDQALPDDDLADVRLEAGQTDGLSAADNLPAADGPTQAQRPANSQGNSDASISVLGADSALNVIVRAEVSQDGNSILREIVESTAAEFGMKVSGFRFNGVNAKPPTAASGDQNGSDTR